MSRETIDPRPQHRGRPRRDRAPLVTAVPGDTETEQRARILTRFSVGVGFYDFGFVPILYIADAVEAAVFTAVITLLMSATPLVVRWTRSLWVGANWFIAFTVALFGGLPLMLGGLTGPTTPILALAPVCAVFLLSRTAGIFWGFVVLTVIGVYVAMLALGVELEPQINPSALTPLRVAGLLTVITVSLLFILQYDAAKASALDSIKQANQRMRRLISHLDATSAELSRSAAEFLGTRPDASERERARADDDATGRDGLTQQMISMANSGRDMIGIVGASIHGMIEQYKNISSRIHELHRQSGIISELVRAIDNISNHLDLMALNTGIEASHAGVAGKRFKLLAEDMRRLAERVIDETHRIKDSIRRVQKLTDDALDASVTGQGLTDEGTVQLEAMSRTFDDMYHLIERTAQASQRVTTGTMAQLNAIHSLVTESLRNEA